MSRNRTCLPARGRCTAGRPTRPARHRARRTPRPTAQPRRHRCPATGDRRSGRGVQVDQRRPHHRSPACRTGARRGRRRRGPPTASTGSTCGRSSPTRSPPPRASSTRASVSGSSIPPAAPTTAPDLSESRSAIDGFNQTMVDEIALQWNSLHSPSCAAELAGRDGRRGRRASARRAVSAGPVVGDPVLLPTHLSSRDIRRSASTLPPV